MRAWSREFGRAPQQLTARLQSGDDRAARWLRDPNPGADHRSARQQTLRVTRADLVRADRTSPTGSAPLTVDIQPRTPEHGPQRHGQAEVALVAQLTSDEQQNRGITV
ncbi:MAG: DUF2384 domain-containing protein [Xanthomonadales bacterium]|nr:DUF2384 domain-containing protein [Xanthomonadales bacterium]